MSEVEVSRHGSPLKVAFIGHPALGGIGTVLRELRRGLAAHGIDVSWIGMGAPDGSDPDGAQGGVAIPRAAGGEGRQGLALLDELERGGYDAVIVNVLAEAVATNAMRYLSRRVPRLLIVHNITPGTYGAARAIRDHVHATVAISPRIRDDLVAMFGFAPERVVTLPSGIATERFTAVARPARSATLRILSLGRIEDAAKGVLWLPAILGRLADLPVTLTVAGDGPDRQHLERALAPFGPRVDMLGAVAPEAVPALVGRHDVFLMPSRYEGQGLALVEAMAAGCVPLVSRIAGVTDFVVEDGVSGFLFPVGDVAAAAAQLRRLTREPELLARCSTAARAAAAGRFTTGGMAAGYARLLAEIIDRPCAIAEPLDRAAWVMERRLRPGLRTYLPRPVKNGLRLIRERLRA